MGGGDIRLETKLSNPLVLKGVANVRQVLFNVITSGQQEQLARPPLNLAVVLDRSGSMSGGKLANAKEASKMVLKNLAKDDVFHLVVYDTTVEVVCENMTSASVQEVCKRIDAITDRDCTNLYAGLEKGVELVKAHHRPGLAKRVFLLSDGLANEGKSAHSDINALAKTAFESQVSIDTFGIGDDFDEKLMKSIAEYGRGAFYYLKDPSVIQTLVGSALQGLLKLFAIDASLTLRGVGDAVLTKVYSVSSDLSAPVSLGDIHQNNLRQVVCEVTATPPPARADGPTEALHYTLSYIPTLNNPSNRRETLEGRGVVSYTEDQALNKDTNKDKEGEVAVVVQKSAEADAQVLKLVETGNLEPAKKLQQESIDELQRVLPNDTTGMVAVLLKLQQQAAEALKTKGNSKETVKQISHCGYAKRRGSAHYCAGYD